MAVLAVSIALGAVTFVPAPPSRVAASDPTLDAALYAIVQRTAWAGQTRDAREAELASQRITATAQALEALRAARTATASAEETRTAETRVARTATAHSEETRSAETRVAQTTAAETRAAETQSARTATAIASETRRAEESARQTATVSAEQTRIAHEQALLASETRAAQARFVGTWLVVALLVLALVALSASAVRALWRVRRPVVVETVAAAPTAPEPDVPAAAAESALPPTQVIFSDAGAQTILDLISNYGHSKPNPNG